VTTGPAPGEEARRRAGKRFLGALLMAAGAMVALLCGACTLLFGLALGAASFRHGAHSDLGALALPLIVGGIPAAGGVVVFLAGLRIFRAGRPARRERNFD
jgi:hypothetical protein